MAPDSSAAVDWRSYWNDRYRSDPTRHGDDPNVFVVGIVEAMPPGRALDAACGRGRNAVWLAGRGHAVTAVDLSDVAVAQGRALAAEREVTVDFVQADFLAWEPPAAGFDLVLLSYLQLPPPVRRAAHRRAAAAAAPGGAVVVVAHHRDNVRLGVGGPDYPEVLYDEGTLAADFADLTIERNERVLRPVRRDDMAGTAIDVVLVARRPVEQ